MINADTRAALAEYEEMKVNPEAYKRYASFDDAMNEVLADDESVRKRPKACVEERTES